MLQVWPARPGADRRFYGRRGLPRHCRAHGSVFSGVAVILAATHRVGDMLGCAVVLAATQRVGSMLEAGGTCEFNALTECRRPASTSDTGFCACLRPAAGREGNERGAGARQPTEHDRGDDERGAARAREPALLTSGARMAERSQDRVSAGQDARSERPATGMGSPSRRTTHDPHRSRDWASWERAARLRRLKTSTVRLEVE